MFERALGCETCHTEVERSRELRRNVNRTGVMEFWRWLPLMLLINTANSFDHNESGCFVVKGPEKIFEYMALIPCVPLYFPSSPRVK